MGTDGPFDVYSLREVARAAGVSEAQARALSKLSGGNPLLSSRDAVRLGRALVADRRAGIVAAEAQLFSRISDATSLNLRGLPLAVSGSLHAVLLASIIFVLGFRTSAATAARDRGRGTGASGVSRDARAGRWRRRRWTASARTSAQSGD